MNLILSLFGLVLWSVFTNCEIFLVSDSTGADLPCKWVAEVVVNGVGRIICDVEAQAEIECGEINPLEIVDRLGIIGDSHHQDDRRLRVTEGLQFVGHPNIVIDGHDHVIGNSPLGDHP